MRTRLLTSLTNTEVESYLSRNDIIFIPVGNVEVHGGLPEDCEYVGPLAFAQKMAEEVDGLVLPYLAYFFPGGTVVGKGTVYITPSEGLAYLKAIARSLLRQGFAGKSISQPMARRRRPSARWSASSSTRPTTRSSISKPAP